MPTDTAETGNESFVWQISVRAWLVLILVSTTCGISIFSAICQYKIKGEVAVTDPLYSLVLLAVGYYFGQKKAT
jgi:hypothetical protein